MSPTTTELLPPLMARASGAWIWFMSHCRPERLSEPGAGVGGAMGSLAPAASSSSLVANGAVATTAVMPFAFDNDVTKPKLCEDATATPMASYDATSVPPAARTSALVLAPEACWVYSIRYVEALLAPTGALSGAVANDAPITASAPPNAIHRRRNITTPFCHACVEQAGPGMARLSEPLQLDVARGAIAKLAV